MLVVSIALGLHIQLHAEVEVPGVWVPTALYALNLYCR